MVYIITTHLSRFNIRFKDHFDKVRWGLLSYFAVWLAVNDILEGVITSIFWAQGSTRKNEMFTSRHGVTPKKPSISISTVVRTSDFTNVVSVVLE